VTRVFCVELQTLREHRVDPLLLFFSLSFILFCFDLFLFCFVLFCFLVVHIFLIFCVVYCFCFFLFCVLYLVLPVPLDSHFLIFSTVKFPILNISRRSGILGFMNYTKINRDWKGLDSRTNIYVSYLDRLPHHYHISAHILPLIIR